MKKVDFDNEFKNPGSEYRSIPFWAWNDELLEKAVQDNQLPLKNTYQKSNQN